MNIRNNNFLKDFNDNFGLYIHIPFCIKKCSYCDFYSIKYNKSIKDKFLTALKKEILLYSKEIDSKIETIYFGGGTPSLLSIEDINELLKLIKNYFSIIPNAEVSLEANPDSLNINKIKGYKESGINRLSIGVQSFADEELERLGRLHDGERAENIIKHVDNVFSNYNFDLIFAIPEQNYEEWKNNLNKVIEINPPHLSLYNLQIEKGTLINKKIKNGELNKVSQKIDARMYKKAIKEVAKINLKQYEISNFAKKGYQSKHNLIYWEYKPYLGLGPASHSFTLKTRFYNTSSLKEYLNNINKNRYAIKEYNKLNLEERMAEKMIMGLRLMKGVSFQEFYKRFDIKLNEVYGKEIEELISQNLLIKENNRLKLTERGKLLGNKVFVKFI